MRVPDRKLVPKDLKCQGVDRLLLECQNFQQHENVERRVHTGTPALWLERYTAAGGNRGLLLGPLDFSKSQGSQIVDSSSVPPAWKRGRVSITGWPH